MGIKWLRLLFIYLKQDEATKINVGKEVLSANKPEMCFLVVGCLMAAVSGLVQSGFTIVYTEIYDVSSPLWKDAGIVPAFVTE